MSLPFYTFFSGLLLFLFWRILKPAYNTHNAVVELFCSGSVLRQCFRVRTCFVKIVSVTLLCCSCVWSLFINLHILCQNKDRVVCICFKWNLICNETKTRPIQHPHQCHLVITLLTAYCFANLQQQPPSRAMLSQQGVPAKTQSMCWKTLLMFKLHLISSEALSCSFVSSWAVHVLLY